MCAPKNSFIWIAGHWNKGHHRDARLPYRAPNTLAAQNERLRPASAGGPALPMLRTYVQGSIRVFWAPTSSICPSAAASGGPASPVACSVHTAARLSAVTPPRRTAGLPSTRRAASPGPDACRCRASGFSIRGLGCYAPRTQGQAALLVMTPQAHKRPSQLLAPVRDRAVNIAGEVRQTPTPPDCHAPNPLAWDAHVPKARSQ